MKEEPMEERDMIWEYRYLFVDLKNNWSWPNEVRNEVKEALNREGKQGWDCFSMYDEGEIVLDDGSQRGRVVYRIVLWLKRPGETT